MGKIRGYYDHSIDNRFTESRNESRMDGIATPVISEEINIFDRSMEDDLLSGGTKRSVMLSQDKSGNYPAHQST